jgi:hypothetical protein
MAGILLSSGIRGGIEEGLTEGTTRILGSFAKVAVNKV